MLRSEVLPAPFGPMMERMRPLGMSTDTSSTAVTPPKCFDTPAIDNCAAEPAVSMHGARALMRRTGRLMVAGRLRRTGTPSSPSPSPIAPAYPPATDRLVGRWFSAEASALSDPVWPINSRGLDTLHAATARQRCHRAANQSDELAPLHATPRLRRRHLICPKDHLIGAEATLVTLLQRKMLATSQMGPQAEVGACDGEVRFTLVSGRHRQLDLACPFSAMCGRLRVGKKNLDVAGLVGAAMCSAYRCGSHDRWP